jgi:hypothetical protein
MSLPGSKVVRLSLLALLFVGGYAVRDYRIHSLPLEFHPVRQYHSAIIARALYYRHVSSLPDWKRRTADCARQREDGMELPVLENLASLSYRIRGRERVWMPRLFSSIFWLIGGVFLYLISRRFFTEVGGLISLAYFLFLPYGVLASRSFQPDPLMVMMLLVSIYFIVRCFESPTPDRIVAAMVSSGLALLVKPQCLPVLFASYAAVALFSYGLRAVVRGPSLWILPLIAVLPALLFYLSRNPNETRMGFYWQIFFRAHYFVESSFWLGWLNMMDRVVGLGAFVAGLIGAALAGKGLPRALLLGLWAGYFVFGFIFNYEIHTHDYYQLQLIPIVALSLAPLAVVVANALKSQVAEKSSEKFLIRALLVLAAVVALSSYLRSVGPLLNYADRDRVTIAEDVGRRVEHSSHVFFLSYADGEEVEYHGEVCGIPWPFESDLETARRMGFPLPTAAERYKTLAEQYSPQFFVVTQMEEYEKQPDLQDFLKKSFRLLVSNPRYLIFDLRKPAE